MYIWVSSLVNCVFFFKQKTAYEMRISDWSSDVCSSDLERGDCISLLDRPICAADGPADSIRQPVVAPDRDVRPFQDVLIDLGARLGLPGLTNDDGTPRFPGGYADYIANHARAPGIGMLRSEERRVGKEGGSRGKSRGWPEH